MTKTTDKKVDIIVEHELKSLKSFKYAIGLNVTSDPKILE